jgi:hypothetical protein
MKNRVSIFQRIYHIDIHLPVFLRTVRGALCLKKTCDGTSQKRASEFAGSCPLYVKFNLKIKKPRMA